MSLKIKTFYLLRHKDVSGISGTGIVATGCIFPNGRVVMQWCSFRSSLEICESLENLIEIHSHGGATEVVMGDPPSPDDKPKKTRRKRDELK